MNICRYSTGLGVTGGSALIHEFYSREVPNPIHLTVDTGFSTGEGTIKAYVSVNLSLGDRQLAAQFQEIPLDLRMVEAEQVGCMDLLNSITQCLLLFLVILFTGRCADTCILCFSGLIKNYILFCQLSKVLDYASAVDFVTM